MVLFSKSHLFVSLLFFSLSLSAEPPKIILSEIYRDPPGTETSLGGGLSHEFIELTNISTDTFYIDSMLITDGSQADSVVLWNTELAGHEQCVFGKNYLLPSQSALILDPDYEAAITANPVCRFNISPGTLILTVNSSDLGDGLQSDDGLLLFKGSKKVISRLLFSASDEPWVSSAVPITKIRLTSPTNKEGTSVVPVSLLFDTISFDNCSNGITPGYFEGLREMWLTEWKPGKVDTVAETVCCSLRCMYCGVSTIPGVSWQVSTGNSRIEEGQALVTNGIVALSIVLPFGKGDVTFQIGAKSKWLIDCQMYKSIDNCILITEIYPKAKADETEWLELYNNSKTSTFNLQHWRFGNNEDMVELVDSRYSVGPGEYIVVCKDTNLLKVQYPAVARKIEPSIWHTLNNYKDTIMFFTSNNLLVDKISYDSKNLDDWLNQSIERVDVNGSADDGSRWRVAVTPSPGAPARSRVFVNKQMETGPIPFTPNGDGRNDLLMIRVPYTYAMSVTVSIYSFDGRKVKEFKGPLQDTYFWDGRKDNGAFAPVGPFFIIAEVIAQGAKIVYKNKGVSYGDKGCIVAAVFYLAIHAELLRDPFPLGYGMGNLGTILWYNGHSAKQSWIPAAICDSSLKKGFDIAVVSYYEEMDNLQDRYLYQLSGGVFLTCRHFYMKASFSYFDAFNTYFEQSLFLSAALSLVRSLNISLEGRFYRVGLSGVSDEVHTIGELGVSAWLGMQFVAFSFQCKHLIVNKSNIDGMDPQMSVTCGIHTPSSRFGAQGVMLEITPNEESSLRWRIGEEVRILKWLAIQVGIANNPVLVSLGLSIDLQLSSVSAALVNQPQLGWSRGVYLGYSRP